MRRAGSSVHVEQCDISDNRDCARLFEGIDRLPHRLRGIIHSAGVLKDSSIRQTGWDDFAPVLASKVLGSWNLHLAAQDRMLDFFVMFSSAASSLGNRGQGNYAAANSFMNALANYRRSLGLCANSICWGPWAEVGMAARGIQPGVKLARDGNSGIKPVEGIAAMFGIIQKDLAVPSVLDMNWSLFLESVPEILADTYFERLKAGKALVDAPAVEGEPSAQLDASFPSAQRIREADLSERPALIMGLTRKVAARVMGHGDPSKVLTDVALTRMGMDSLMAMTLRHQVEKRLSIALPFAFLLDDCTLEDIAAYIIKEMKA
jgi:NAD(P)-dependent dehydrogenase (short-subunit alcohol dehydrogenase family)/acyl carrier protein